MGWLGQQNRGDDADRDWSAAPLRERWLRPRAILFGVIAASTATLWLWAVAARFWR